ncbi:centrosomal protein of 44 kDa isoform X2 [Apteryx mantelli]|uniref:Centrosomal protein of 44 kDa n=1 Tax=Apteryx mantelli TaxID=2696672 RepID=A0ABM4EMT8_9AVES|nr:PREDICTED: centrosomal protein of 44 kDa isoform X2 [Apteryx mantelli mantelli]
MATGDLKGSLRKIEQGLRLLNYPRDVDYTGLIKGDPAAFLPIISYSFTSFSTYIAELLVKCDVELTAKSDLRFIEAIYKLLRDLFQYKPILTKQQFLQFGFAERKMQIVCDIINCVMKKHKELSSLNKAKSQTRKKLGSFKYDLWSNCEKSHADPSGSAMSSKQKPQVERHPESEDGDNLHPPALAAEGDNEELYLNHNVLEVKCEQVLEDDSQIEFLKSQLADCQEKLHKLDWMEDKLHVLEDRLKGKSDLSTEFNNVSQECTYSRIPVSRDTERKEEMPESLHQLSGYSSLLSTDPSPKAMTINYDLTDFSKEMTRQRMERISKMIEETSELLKTSSSTSEKT